MGRRAAPAVLSECETYKAVDGRPAIFACGAHIQLEHDEPDQQCIERGASGDDLLRKIGDRSAGGDHRLECADLAAEATGVPEGCGSAARGFHLGHGLTNTAPVMPAAAWPGMLQWNVCVPGWSKVSVMIRVSPGSRIASTPSRPGM